MTTLSLRTWVNPDGLPALVLRRALSAIPLILVVIVVTFMLTRMAPGDPAMLLAGDTPSPEFLAQVRAEHGLDQPLSEQLRRYVLGALTFNFGSSIHYQKPVIEVILERVPATLLLTGAAMVLASIVGIACGVWAARHKGKSVDFAVGAASMVGYSVPSFWLGQLLILLFAVTLNWLPSGGMVSTREQYSGLDHVLDVAAHLVLPAVTLMTFELALISRFTRTAMIEALGKEYVLVARAKGARMDRVIWRHAFPNAVVTTITIIGLEFGVLLAGAVVTETVFAWPGIGRLFFEAIARRDFPLLNGCFIFASVAVVVVNLLTDVAAAVLDPRTRR